MNSCDLNEKVTSKHRFQLLNKSIGIYDNKVIYNDKEIDEFVCKTKKMEERGEE
jgi:hypothetical protein